jgi:hypothetical protein
MHGNRRIYRLRDAAQALVMQGQTTDIDAAALKAMAGHRTNNLLWAAAWARSQGWVDEDPLIYWTNELLQAAATGRSVRPPTPDQQALFGKITVLYDHDPERAYARLIDMYPAIAETEAALRATRTARSRTARADPQPHHFRDDDEEIAAVLRPIVGPHAHTDDPLLRTHTAYARASYHFQQIPA